MGVAALLIIGATGGVNQMYFFVHRPDRWAYKWRGGEGLISGSLLYAYTLLEGFR